VPKAAPGGQAGPSWAPTRRNKGNNKGNNKERGSALRAYIDRPCG